MIPIPKDKIVIDNYDLNDSTQLNFFNFGSFLCTEKLILIFCILYISDKELTQVGTVLFISQKVQSSNTYNLIFFLLFLFLCLMSVAIFFRKYELFAKMSRILHFF